MFAEVFEGQRVLVTGHNGFKGAWLSLWLERLGARVVGLALEAEPSPTLHEILRPGTFEAEHCCDVRDAQALARIVRDARPDFVFHLAAQSLVRRSYREPALTFETNALGTLHLLESVRDAGLTGPVVVVTSDKCYENRELGRPFRVGDPLGGRDPYSMSKAAAELVTASFRASYFDGNGSPPVVTVRGGNVIGGGDYAEDRLIPDAVRAQLRGEPLVVRNPTAIRPWQHVLDCLSGYLRVAQWLATSSDPAEGVASFNIGPEPGQRIPVSELVRTFLARWPGRYEERIDPRAPHEAGHLELDIEETRKRLGWSPAWSATTAVEHTADWYRARHEERQGDLHALCVAQIEAWAASATPGARGDAA